MFTVEERDRVRDRILEMARGDARVVAGAVVGSMALGGGDQWSDLDLTFGLATGVTNSEVLEAWTRDLEREFGAVTLFDLPFLSSLYRVFLFPGNLQVDVSFTPGAEFGALGPRFKLLFGEAVSRSAPPAAPARYLFGLGVHHALRARFCIERGRLWQAEFWISGVRDQALALACLARGLESSQGRGLDQLPEETRARFDETLVRSIERAELLRALRCSTEALLLEAGAERELAERLEPQLRDLTSADWPEARPRGTSGAPTTA